MNIGDLILTLLADGSKLEADVTRQADDAAGKAGTKSGKTLGGKMADAAKGGLSKLGAAGGYIFASAVEAGATFEDQLRTINTVAGLSDDELSKVGDSIQALSRETGKTTDDLTSGFYDLVSAGVPADKAINVLRDSAKFATGALGTTAESVDLVTSAMNAYGLSAEDSTRITDIFAKSVADGKVTAAELGSSIANIAPIAASAGVKLEEVAAGYALLTAKGVPAAQAATQMRAAISALLTPNVQLNEIQKQTGINFAELARSKGLAVALEELRKATKGNADAFAKSLGSVEAYQFALATTGENASAMADEVVAASNATGLAQAQYDEKSKSSVEQGKRLSATLNTLMQDFGGVFGAAAPVVTVLNGLAPALRGLVSPAKLVGGLLGGLAGKLGKPLLGAITGAFASAELGTRLETLGLRLQTAWIKGMTRFGDPIVSKISGFLGSVFDRIPGSGALSSATSKLGSFLGSGLGKALSVGFAAVAVVELVNTYNEIKDGLTKQGEQIGKDVGNEIATGSIEALEQSKGALEKGIRDLAEVHDFGIFTNDARRNLQDQLAAVEHEIATRNWESASIEAAKRQGQQYAAAVGDGAAAAAPAAAAKATTTFAGKVKDDTDIVKAALQQGRLAAGAVAQGIVDAKASVDQAWTSLVDLIKNAATPAERAGTLIGRLASKKLAKALNDNRPEVRAQAEYTLQVTVDELGKIVDSGGRIGKKGMQALRDAMHSKNPTVAEAARQIYLKVKGQTDKISKAGTTAGANAATNVATQLDKGSGKVGSAAARLAARIAGVMLAQINGTKPLVKPGQAPVAFDVGTRFVPRDMVAAIHRGEIIVPPREAAAVRSGAAAIVGNAGDLGPPAGSGVTNNYNLTVDGLVEARDPLEIAREMRRVARFGPAIERTRPAVLAGSKS